MDADSSYGGSDTAPDSHSGHDHSQIHDHDVTTTSVHQVSTDTPDHNNYYHKNEISLPVNYDEADLKADSRPTNKEPHYLSTAKLNVNEEPHSNLEDMSNFKSTNFLNQGSPDSRNKRTGIDNPAFQEDEHRTNGAVKSTFDSSKPYNGELNSTSNLHEPATEAVNLELINLKPIPGKDVAGPYDNGVNGIPVKKDQDLDTGANAYDEYFVPVNEHRKYMRGEKLYVTMDKRAKKGRNKCLCWSICLCIVAAAVIIGILAAVGVIGNQGPMAKEVSARKFDGSEPQVEKAGILGSSSISSSTQPPIEKISRTPEPPLSTVSSMLPSTETSMIQVPRALEGEFTIDNREFSPELFNKNSTEYQTLAKSLEDEIKNTLFTKNVLNNGPADIEVKIMEFAPGSIVVKYRVGWKFRDGLHNVRDPLSKESLQTKMQTALERNSDLMDTYHVKDNSISTQNILDLCQIQNNGCEHLCIFDYKHLNFRCTCPEGQILARNQKDCIDNGFVHENNNFEHNSFENTEPKAEPEPTAEPVPSPEPSAEPEPTPEPSAEPEPTPEPSAEPEPSPEPSAQPEPTPEPSPEPNAHPEPTPEPSAQPEPTPEPTAQPEPSPEPTAQPESPPEIIVQPEPTPEPILEHSTEQKSSSEPNSTPEPSAEPQPIHIHSDEPSMTTTEPPVDEENAKDEILVGVHQEPEPKTSPEPVPTPEPTAEHSTEEVNTEVPNKGSVEEIKQDMSTEMVENVTVPYNSKQTHSDYTSMDHFNRVSEEVHTTTEANRFDNNIPVFVTQETPIATTTVAHNETNENKVNETIEQIRVESLDQSEGRNFKGGLISAEPEESTTQEVITTTDSDNMIPTTMLPMKNIFEESSNVATSTHDPQLNISNIVLTTTPESVPGNSNIAASTENSKNFKLNEWTTESSIFISATNSHQNELESSTISEETDSPTTKKEMLSDEAINKINLMNIVTPEAAVIMSTTLPNVSDVTTIKSDEEMITTTPNNTVLDSNEISVVVNNSQNTIESQSVQNESTTTKPEVQTQSILINNEQLTAEEEEPRVIEFTTKSPTLVQNNETSEALSNETYNDSTAEQHHHEDFSPFLPDIENDTIVNSLDSYKHFSDHEFENSTEKQPSLEHDQLNHTNPADPPPIADAGGLAVAPLLNKENEILTTHDVTTESQVDVTTNKMQEDMSLYIDLTKNKNTLDTITNKTEETVNTTTENVVTTTPPVQNTSQITTTVSPKVESTFPPEIINNVHSNSYFETQEKQDLTQPQNINETSVTNSTEQNNINNFQDIGSSTEDLLALETTTRKKIEVSTTVKMTVDSATIAPTTIRPEEIMTTITENLVNNVSSTEQTTTMLPENTTRADNSVSSSNMDVSAVLPNNKYEVRETVTDITTTEKLFVAVKPNDMQKSESEEALAVAPLNPTEETNTINPDSNDITAFETDSVLSKFRNENNDIKENENSYEKLDKKDIFSKTQEVTEPIVVVSITEKDATTLKPEVVSNTNVSENNFEKPVTENFELTSIQRCASGQFQCTNGTSVKDGSYCIPSSDRCDSVQDCSDGSDEVGCDQNGCLNNFKCASGQCLKRHLVCDGIINCNDGTDETDCEKWTCNPDELSCGTGKKCIPLHWKCDGKSQCPDNSDELNCPSDCLGDTFHCIQQNTCIPLSWRCDGSSDCKDGEDEKLCECDNESFKCQTGGGCISKTQRCDGIPQCSDRSDEWNCISLNDKNILQIQPEVNVSYPVCGDSPIWNTSYAKLACEYMGYPDVSNYNLVPKSSENESSIFYTVKDSAVYGAPFLSRLEKTESGSCEKWISLTCQEYACGTNRPVAVPQGRIAGGEPAAPTQWPSLALLRNTKSNVQCTASLVAPSWVAASYSCVTDNGKQTSANPRDWMLYAGSVSFFAGGDNSSTQVKRVAEVVPHPQAKFVNFEYTNDVVLLRLSEALTLNVNVSVLCLPNKDMEPQEFCVIAGWGINKPGDPNREQYLQYWPVPTIQSDECNSTKHYNGMLTKDKICAGSVDSEKSPCYNDKGAPLMCLDQESHIWEFQGLLSHHENCGKSQHPAIFTALTSDLRRWVTSTIGASVLSSRDT